MSTIKNMFKICFVLIPQCIRTSYFDDNLNNADLFLSYVPCQLNVKGSGDCKRIYATECCYAKPH